jgi:hypothetical protein
VSIPVECLGHGRFQAARTNCTASLASMLGALASNRSEQLLESGLPAVCLWHALWQGCQGQLACQVCFVDPTIPAFCDMANHISRTSRSWLASVLEPSSGGRSTT